MKEKNQTFKKVGIVLLLTGVIDSGILLFCMATERYYASNFNIFVILPGILLIMGGVKTARFMRWLSIFAAGLAPGLYSVATFSKPVDLLLVQLRLDTYDMVVDFIALLVFIGVLSWVYLQLSNTESSAILQKAGYKTGKPQSAIITAALIIVLAAVGSYKMLSGESVAKAKMLAAERAGNHYRYYVNSLEFSGNHVTATLTVYNSETLASMQVEW